MTETGRGAWTPIGKDNGEAYYKFTKNKPLDGSTPEKGLSYEAVHLGVKAIQNRLLDLGYNTRRENFEADGVFGVKTKRQVKHYQRDNGISTSGIVGFTTASSLFKGAIAEHGEAFKFDKKYIFGLMLQESGTDPGAVGWFTPGDRGLYQYNTLVHDVSFEQAHDYQWATDAVLARFNNAWKKYKGKGSDLRVNCSIAQHNAPAWADQWFSDGVPPNETILQYVGKVTAFSNQY